MVNRLNGSLVLLFFVHITTTHIININEKKYLGNLSFADDLILMSVNSDQAEVMACMQRYNGSTFFSSSEKVELKGLNYCNAAGQVMLQQLNVG